MKILRAILVVLLLVLLPESALVAQSGGPDIALTGSIGIKGAKALLGASAVSLTADADYTLTPAQYATKRLTVTSTVSLTVTRNLIAPLNFGQEFVVENATTGGQSICVQGTSGGSACIKNGETLYVGSNGTRYSIIAKANSATDIAGLIQAQTNCNTSGNVWEPSSNTCIARGITALTGDVTASGSGSAAATLATVNTSPGSCGDSTHVCQATTDGKGRVTAQSAVGITGLTGGTTNAAPLSIGAQRDRLSPCEQFRLHGISRTGRRRSALLVARRYAELCRLHLRVAEQLLIQHDVTNARCEHHFDADHHDGVE